MLVWPWELSHQLQPPWMRKVTQPSHHSTWGGVSSGKEEAMCTCGFIRKKKKKALKTIFPHN